MTTHLDKIVATTRSTVAASRERTPLAELERLAALHTPRGWAAALRAASAKGPAIIAELKKASPSKGLIRADFDPPQLAKAARKAAADHYKSDTTRPRFRRLPAVGIFRMARCRYCTPAQVKFG